MSAYHSLKKKTLFDYNNGYIVFELYIFYNTQIIENLNQSLDIFCLDGGPISFRPRPGASIPNCLPAPGPVKRSNFLSKTNITAMVEIRKFIVNRR